MTAMEASNPELAAKKKRTSHSQEPAPPPGAGGERGAGDGPHLASRWRLLSCFAPLNLDQSDLPSNREAFAGVVSRILSVHWGPCRRFCVPAGYLEDRPAAMDAWLWSPALDNLEEIDFILPPASTLRFLATLRVAALRKCHIPDGLAQSLQLPQLKELALEEECLLLSNCTGFGCARITSSSLRGIGVRAECYQDSELRFSELIIDDAPCLERLLYAEYFGLNVSAVTAPKLLTGDIMLFCWSVQFLQTCGLNAVSLMTVLHSVKILAVNSWVTELDLAIGLMKCFPCLEKLYIQSCGSVGQNLWHS
uniref:F-box/LRR-repeat protein 15/At3g58940/PEG3-like LRR domain-containing protein n=1 Tax=Setaria italica TaxID=4555 RepID=K4A2L8_SETIT